MTIKSLRSPELDVTPRLKVKEVCFRKMAWNICDITEDKTKSSTIMESFLSSNICISLFSLFRVLLRVRMLYYLKQEVIGNEFQKVFDGTDARWTIESIFTCLFQMSDEYSRICLDLNKTC